MADEQVAQLAVETLSAQEAATLSVAQAVVETLSGTSRPLSVAQLVVETLSQNRQPIVWPPIEPPIITESQKPILLEVTEIRRALSGTDGDYESGRFTVTIADVTRELREILTKNGSKYFLNKVVEVRMASLASVKAHASSRRIAYGIVIEPPAFDGLTLTLKCVDFVGSTLWTNE